MSVPVHGGNQVVFVGDSITAQNWMGVSGGLIDQINAQLPNVTKPRPGSVAGGAARASLAGGATTGSVASVTTSTAIRAVNSGLSGDDTGAIAALVAPRITNYNPDVIVLLVGVNDVFFNESDAFTQTNYDSILSQIRAWSPTVPVACLSILMYGELWAAGPIWNNAHDAIIDSKNAIIQTLCTTYGCTYVDVRSQILQWETVNNAPAPGVSAGIFTQGGGIDPGGIHPNNTGRLQMGNYTISTFAVSP